MRIFLSVLLMLYVLEAQSIDNLVEQALKKHPSLQSIHYRLSSMDERIAKTQLWENPDLSFFVNDIQFEEPFNRSLEPMQFQAVNIKQKFPWFGKLAARKTYAQEQKNVVLDSYEAARIELAKQVKMTAYTVKELEARMAVLRSYQHLAKENIEIYTATISTEPKSHTASISAELSLFKINIQLERYTALLQSQKEKLGYLTQQDIKTVSGKQGIERPLSLDHYLARYEHNPTYRMKLSQNRAAFANSSLVDLEATPDPYVQMGYFNRNSYPDYGSVTIGVSLPIYGKETLNSQIAKKEALSAKSDVMDYKAFLQSEIRSNYARLNEAYRIYRIIQEKSLPQLSHMLELQASAIKEGADLFTYTQTLEQQLALEEESLSIKAEYLRTKATLHALIGEI
ncbi:TolC family protein [Sulfurovum sp. zt1-1]|uniref:TolC family protein n=1 Tax=Sulfurovum zhangzhouensis TaxID=3019067 RepID=A0ABT7R099_9BACT|nr:TolC family protein [Sulfurovum zhangzhouensis]MDM5272519.1 TolC family protein [Sulfurovum zhangzhouensis]